MGDTLPNPRQDFTAVAGEVAEQLQALDALRERYRRELHAGAILPSVTEATRIALTYNSNAIEGNTLTLRETQLVLEGITPPGGKPLREIYEARNHDRALGYVEAIAKTDAPVNEAELLEVHRLVMTDIADHAGRFRRGRVLIAGSGFVPPGAHRFDELIGASLAAGNRASLHPVLRSAELHYNLVAIHPFEDGNGRTARLMMNRVALQAGYPHIVLEVARRAEYLAALDRANQGDVLSFAQFVIDSAIASARRMLGE
ncbi:MAG TPA: Fic family protein [Tepidisphaeraceae bacterium]|nr:Fic family protein [Tepidisphaeraceae bacterium]